MERLGSGYIKGAGFGSKIENLNTIIRNGLGKVPLGIVIGAGETKATFTKKAHLYLSSKDDFAVRSSGAAEDGDDTSYAGQHLTRLNVKVDDIWEAIHECRESGKEAQAYRGARGSEARPINVLVQKMVDPRFAGVLFTGNPANKNSDEMVLEYTEGLADKLVGGEITPTGSYDLQIVTNPDAHQVIRREGAPWLWGTFKPVIDLGRKIDAFFAKPMDIEWAIDHNDVLWCLQARPITGVETWDIPAPVGRALGGGIGAGVVKWMPGDGEEFEEGGILFAEMTNPRMVREMVASRGIATVQGGRTCHAAIVAREIGRPCVVGVAKLARIPDGADVEVDSDIGEVRRV